MAGAQPHHDYREEVQYNQIPSDLVTKQSSTVSFLDFEGSNMSSEVLFLFDQTVSDDQA